MSWHGLAYVLLSITLVVTGQTLLRAGMMRIGPIGKARLSKPLRLVADIARLWQIWVGLTFYVISGVSWILALATVPLSIAYPFLGLSYVGVAAVAVLALGEWLTPAQWLGIVFVISGVVTVALS